MLCSRVCCVKVGFHVDLIPSFVPPNLDNVTALSKSSFCCNEWQFTRWKTGCAVYVFEVCGLVNFNVFLPNPNLKVIKPHTLPPIGPSFNFWLQGISRSPELVPNNRSRTLNQFLSQLDTFILYIFYLFIYFLFTELRFASYNSSLLLFLK